MLKNVKITENTLEKIFCYAERTCKLNKGSLECYGYLVAPAKKNDGIVYDAFLPSNQLAEVAKDVLSSREVINASREIRSKGYKIIGCWQSHGDGLVFHSRDDDKNLENLLLSVSLNSRFPVFSNSLVLYGDNLTIKDKEGRTDLILPEFFGNLDDNKKFRVNITNGDVSFYVKPGDSYSEYDIGIKMKTIGYAYSIVVNTRKEINAKIGILETCNCCLNSKGKLKNAGIEKIRVDNDIDFNGDSIEEEIKRKVIVNSFWKKLLK